MSHEATNWAIKQRGIKPSAKIVLWQLCDRYHPDHGCFPSLDTLAEDCEMSRRSVQNQIDALVEAGLLRVEKMPRQKGRLPGNRYRFPFESDLGQNLPQAKSALGKNERSPLANSGDDLGQNLPTNPVRETRKGTSNASSDAQSEFDAFWAECPRKVGKGKARQAFAKARKGADATTIIAGMKRHARMVAHTEQQFIPHPATWLNGERWEDEDKPRPVSQQGRKPHWQVMKEKAEGTYRDPEMDAKIARWNRIAAGE